MAGNYSKLVTVVTGQTITASERNNEHDNHITNATPDGLDDASETLGAMQATADPYPAGSASQPTSLRGELQRLRYQMQLLCSDTYWYQDPTFLASQDPTATPAATAATLKARLDHIIAHLNKLNGATNWYDAMAWLSAITPATPGATATSLNNRIAQILYQIKALTGGTNWYDTTYNLFNLFHYKKPNLVYGSATTVTAELGNDGANGWATVIFPDGDRRSTNVSAEYTFTITQTANLSGSHRGGLASGSEATNTWYALYAVKTTDNSSKFVLVGSTTLPLIANQGTLNTAFGANGWVYLGLIRNGDNSAATGDILDFRQHGPITFFKNACTGNARVMRGIRLASNASAASVTWTYAAGTGTTEVPGNVLQGQLSCASGGTANATELLNSGSSIYYFRIPNDAGGRIVQAVFLPLEAGALLSNTGATAVPHDIVLSAFIDSALGEPHAIV